jgi:hypothetical protein
MTRLRCSWCALAALALGAQSASAQAPSENLLAFDNSQAKLVWANRHWQFQAGNILVKDVGTREYDAREALRIIRDLRLEQHGTIGSPKPILEYWLVDGHAPRAFGLHSRLIAFDPAALRVEEIQGQWTIRDALHVYFTFGAAGEDAQQALAVIQKYKFSQVGTVGYPDPVMMFFVASERQTIMAPALMGSTKFSSGKIYKTKSAETVAGVNTQLLPIGRQLYTPDPFQQVRVPVSEHVLMDWRQVRLVQENADWKLVYQTHTLANFGPVERDAQLALAAVQHYRITDFCTIGNPAVFSFYLTSGQAPHGLHTGLPAAEINPELLAIKRDGYEWTIAQGNKILWRVGSNEADAKVILDVLRRYHFDHQCRIGSSESTAFNLLLRSR